MAALEAADEIGLAVIAISMTIIAIFAPASFMSGIAGQFFKQFGITVSVQVFFSLLAARFVTPVLAAYFMKPHGHEEPPPGVMLRALYPPRHLVGAALPDHDPDRARPARDLDLEHHSAAAGVPAGAGSARSTLAIELPPGTQLVATEKVTEDIVSRLRTRPEVKSVFVDGGRVPPGIAEVRRATLIINYVPKGQRKITQRELETDIGQRARERSRYPLLVPRRQRLARDLAVRHRHRHQHRQQCRK